MSAASSASTEGQSEAGSRTIAAVPDVVWGPLAVGSLLGAVGLIGLATGQAWLFPSLGPTAFLQAEQPGQPPARFYNTMVGHLVGLSAGMLAVWMLGASSVPGVLASMELTPVRVWAAVLAAVLTMIGLSLLRASHPPAAATMLLVALGGFDPSWKTAGTILAGVLIIAVLGKAVRFLRLKIFPAPSESSRRGRVGPPR